MLDDNYEQLMVPRERAKSSCLVKGLIVSLDYSADSAEVNLNGSVVTMPIFFHCQGNNDTINGSYAFSVNDEVIVYKDIDGAGTIIEQYVLGHADAVLQECEAPIGLAGFKYDADAVGHAIYEYRDWAGGYTGCSELKPAPSWGTNYYLQVRYDTPQGDDYIYSLGIASAEIIGATAAEYQRVFSVEIRSIKKHGFQIDLKVHKRIFSGEYYAYGKFSASFNTDYTKVYVVWGYSVLEAPNCLDLLTLAGSTTSTLIFEREINDDGSVSWIAGEIVNISCDYYMDALFVDKNGDVFGYFDCEKLDSETATEYTYAKINVDTQVVSSTTDSCLGYTVRDGDFQRYAYSKIGQSPKVIDVRHGDKSVDSSYDSNAYNATACDACCRTSSTCSDCCKLYPYVTETSGWCDKDYATPGNGDDIDYRIGIHPISDGWKNTARYVGSASYTGSCYFSVAVPGPNCSCDCTCSSFTCEYSGVASLTFKYGSKLCAVNKGMCFNRRNSGRDEEWQVVENASPYAPCSIAALNCLVTECGCKLSLSGVSIVNYMPVHNVCHFVNTADGMTTSAMLPQTYRFDFEYVHPDKGTYRISNYTDHNPDGLKLDVLYPLSEDGAGIWSCIIHDQVSVTTYKGMSWSVDGDGTDPIVHIEKNSVDVNGINISVDVKAMFYACSGFTQPYFSHMFFIG